MDDHGHGHGHDDGRSPNPQIPKFYVVCGNSNELSLPKISILHSV
jgi:hypothetical protein